MSRPTRSKLSPWIESLILNYGSQDGGSSSGRLKAQVIGVGQMSQSQAQGSEGPTGLLFLSDGVLQIPAILTTSAWEHLQDQEERECFTSLLNHTVCIQNYTLQFHMGPEQTKCRFFLSVGELATTAAGPVKDSTPCCTTLPSVRQKICETWRALMGQEGQESQSQCGFDLTELLGEWQHDCLQSVLEDIKERLMKASYAVEPQPSTSTFTPSLTCPDTFAAISWDIERIRDKREKCFTVPMNYLLIPEEDAQHLQEHLDVPSSTLIEVSAGFEERSRDLPQILETAKPSVDDDDWRIEGPALRQVDCVTNENPQLDEEDDVLDEVIITRLNEGKIRPLTNPWDMFPPPDETSSEDVSPCATQDHPPVGILTSTRLPTHSSTATPQTSELNSKGEQSELLPYQKPPSSTCLPVTVSTSASTSVTPPEPFTRPDEARAEPEKTNLLASEQESPIFEEVMVEGVERKCRKAKRKRSEPSAEAQNLLAEEEEAQVSGSPPSWLFESKNSSGLEEGSSHQPDKTIEPLCRKISTVHSDGKKFSYSYQVSGKNLQDFSKCKISESLLNWAVKYLVTPRQMDNQHNTSATSNQTSSDRTEITPL
ncbi:adrenocortical dysplasia protein homolog [Cheilinus undulatus]|uniref:adrenocortical dysplasia protein homolog n=1 Tax=Cheilinus undulatus TaxID=241271 RepID=UPI001BD22FDE|nr:adrenocortical dysplasia protein homolog [Cheilinus undulatus]